MLVEKQNMFDVLFKAIPEGVIIVDNEQRIIAANNSVEKMFGYENGELNNQHSKIIIPNRYLTTHKKRLEYFLKKGNLNYQRRGIYLYGLKKNGEEFPVEFSINSFKYYDETFLLALIIDITQRKEIEGKIDKLNLELENKVKQKTADLSNTILQLKEINYNYKKEIAKRIEIENKMKIALEKEKELNELKTKFLSMVSHEFKTPLSGILTSTILLDKYKLTSQYEKRKKHLKKITSKVKYLDNILNDFLSIERIDSSNINYKHSYFNLIKVINEVVYNANMLLKSGQKIIIPLDADDYMLYQDENVLEIILLNLIHNAIKYSPENSIIKIEFEQNSNFVQFKIIDNGIGIPENDQKFIFNRYFRANNVLNIQGTGIGLNIVKSHIENLGGTINFTSKENRGSTFTFKLPISTIKK
ncbi:MAG: PAS domain-containing sensor histidine kinase [Lutibacter sp.]|uniref:PAS domain-containing sensor histidine kinase n=1 Tax=Lutibacter sp. TaxID=1925666 RepID=UPI00299F48CB|nr:PAS domain-containing sensor histidine kinase [Lutibacter sp.]MDX1828998.1 PAS domain-containing sensor histidine kinase [Lutibacter sp.]